MKKPWSGIVIVILLLIGANSEAAARQRDDVMSGAFRCGGISDSRQWLDCIYGAAQPIRAELGLPSVTTTQSSLAASPPTGGTITDQLTRDQVLASAMRCDSLPADRAWLDCFYLATNIMRSELGLSAGSWDASRINQNVSKASVTTNSVQNGFGLAARPMPSAHFIKAQLSSYEFDRYGIFTVTLAGGQVWRQISGDTSYAHWKGPAADYTVTISTGALGSYNLRVANNPGLFKVERVR